MCCLLCANWVSMAPVLCALCYFVSRQQTVTGTAAYMVFGSGCVLSSTELASC